MSKGPDVLGADDDSVRARFAAVERDTDADAHDDLPPVPTVPIQRPGKLGAASTKSGSRGFSQAGLPRVIGGGMFAAGDMRSTGKAFTIGTSLVASIIVGTGAGWLADKYLLHSTSMPWGMIAGFMLGVTAGFINLVRVANQISKE